jgi:isochorismate synthase
VRPVDVSSKQAAPSRPAAAVNPFVFASTTETLLAHESAHVLSCRRTDDLTRCVSTFFEDTARAGYVRGAQILVGALPFSPLGRVHLFQPRAVDRQPGRSVLVDRPVTGASLPTTWRVRAEPSREEYACGVVDALGRMESNNGSSPSLRKVVLGRRLIVEADAPISVEAVLAHLAKDPDSTTYAVPLPAGLDGEPRTLVGASPELLLEKRGSLVRSEPMAGSTPRRQDPIADRRAAEDLLRSDKDLREHAAVVDWVVDRLSPYCQHIHVADSPSLKSTATMWHLVTPVSAELCDARVSSIELSLALHPTPAVCGVPPDAALAAIDDLEPFDRGFFAGAVGWCDNTGDGQWLVTIRCGEISGRRAEVYAGAGIVLGSNPESEVAETSAKMTTFLKALGIDEHGRPLTHSTK